VVEELLGQSKLNEMGKKMKRKKEKYGNQKEKKEKEKRTTFFRCSLFSSSIASFSKYFPFIIALLSRKSQNIRQKWFEIFSCSSFSVLLSISPIFSSSLSLSLALFSSTSFPSFSISSPSLLPSHVAAYSVLVSAITHTE
jgi:hypothetical protein